MANGPIFIFATIAARRSVVIQKPNFHWAEWQTVKRGNFEAGRMTNSTNFGKAV